MIELTHQAESFKQRVRDSFRKQCLQCLGCRAVKIAKRDFVYASGQRDAMVYLIESGQVKLVLPTPEGKECLLSIRSEGDIFGELCLTGQNERLETAVAMEETTLRRIPIRNFMACLRQESLLEGLVQYLALRISEQQEFIAMLATENSEQRLAKTLLHLGEAIGKASTGSTCIKHRISHEELSRMVGTTRPRVGIFLKKFRELGLIRLTSERFLVLDETRLREYMLRDAGAGQEWEPRPALKPLLAGTSRSRESNIAAEAGRNGRRPAAAMGY
jgi:CRP/FNR family transcriptional regulator, cyclic AMP receptor protein